MSRKWPPQFTIRFLEGYEHLPCLWDAHNQSYKNKNDREKSYQKLSELMAIDGFGAAHVKAKIRSIRNAYLLELAKIVKGRQSGADAEEAYRPKVPWFPIADRILRGVVQTRETQALGIDTETQYETDDSVDVKPTVAVDDEFPLPQYITNEVILRRPKSARTAPKKVTKKKSSTGNALKELQRIARSFEGKPNKEDDEFECFGKSVTCQLKKLPESVALESIAYIQSYLVQQRLKPNLEEKMNYSFTIPSPSSTIS